MALNTSIFLSNTQSSNRFPDPKVQMQSIKQVKVFLMFDILYFGFHFLSIHFNIQFYIIVIQDLRYLIFRCTEISKKYILICTFYFIIKSDKDQNLCQSTYLAYFLYFFLNPLLICSILQ